MLCKKYNLNLDDLLEAIVGKICFTLDIYQKYREHFKEKKTTVFLEPIKWDKEEKFAPKS